MATRLVWMACSLISKFVACLDAHDVGVVSWAYEGDSGGIRSASAERFEHTEHGGAEVLVGGGAFFEVSENSAHDSRSELEACDT